MFARMSARASALVPSPLRSGLLLGLAALSLSGCGMPMQGIEAENRAIPYLFGVSACDDATVTGSVIRRFNATEGHYWQSEARIDRLEEVREASFRKNGRQYIPRRGCTATAVFTDNTRRTVHYTVVAESGLYSLGDRVEFCVAGFDRNHIAPPACTLMTR